MPIRPLGTLEAEATVTERFPAITFVLVQAAERVYRTISIPASEKKIMVWIVAGAGVATHARAYYNSVERASALMNNDTIPAQWLGDGIGSPADLEISGEGLTYGDTFRIASGAWSIE